MKPQITTLACWMKTHRFVLAVGLAGVALAVSGLILSADRACGRAANGRIFRSADAVPERAVGLVLGTSRETHHGKPNLHFNQRIEAAAALYRAGKGRHLLVSGHNHIASYDEPDDMRAALMAAGVPASAITCDYGVFARWIRWCARRRFLACRNAPSFPRNFIVRVCSGLPASTDWIDRKSTR